MTSHLHALCFYANRREGNKNKSYARTARKREMGEGDRESGKTGRGRERGREGRKREGGGYLRKDHNKKMYGRVFLKQNSGRVAT